MDANDQVVAQRLALIMSTGIVAVRDEVRRELATVAAILKYNPFMLTTADTVSAKAAMNRSQVIEQQMNKAQGAFDTAIAGALKSFDDYSTAKTQELDDLHTQYETHLLLQGPSRHWQRIAESSWRYAAGAFGLFIFMLLIPAVAIACNWASISSYIDHVVEISKGGISLAAVIVFYSPGPSVWLAAETRQPDFHSELDDQRRCRTSSRVGCYLPGSGAAQICRNAGAGPRTDFKCVVPSITN